MGKLNMEAMKAKLDSESRSGNYNNAEYDKLKQGKNVRRILWPKGDSDSFYSEGFLHFNLGEDGNTVVTCPKTFGSKERCPICEYVEELQKSKNKEDAKLASKLKATRKIYVNTISRDDDEETPKVLPIGVTVLKGLLEAICDPDYGDITDPDEGRDVTITRKGEGMKTEYSVLIKPKASIVSDELSASEIEDEMTDLDSLFVKKSYEELQDILNGESLEDDEEDEEDNDSYDDMSIDELVEICEDRGIKIPAKANKLKLVTLLNKYDSGHNEDDEEDAEEEPEEDDDDEESEDEDAGKSSKHSKSSKSGKVSGKSGKPSKEDDEDAADEEEDDDIQKAIATALAKRKKK